MLATGLPTSQSLKSPNQRDEAVWTDQEGDPTDILDKPLLAAEIFALLIGVLSLLLVIAGLGFYTVKPPGEPDLCAIETLGLQNKTSAEQNDYLGKCHALYSGVFASLGIIGNVHISCGVVSFSTLCGLVLGFRGVHRGDVKSSNRWFCCAAMMDVLSVLIVWVPSLIFPGLAAIVAAGLAPIHAYFITIMVGHYGMKAANSTNGDDGDGNLHMAAHAEEILYAGYAAASRVELCLGIGSACLLSLFWVFIVDAIRNIVTMTCWRPEIRQVDGSQLIKAARNLAECWRRPQYGPTDDE